MSYSAMAATARAPRKFSITSLEERLAPNSILWGLEKVFGPEATLHDAPLTSQVMALSAQGGKAFVALPNPIAMVVAEPTNPLLPAASVQQTVARPPSNVPSRPADLLVELDRKFNVPPESIESQTATLLGELERQFAPQANGASESPHAADLLGTEAQDILAQVHEEFNVAPKTAVKQLG